MDNEGSVCEIEKRGDPGTFWHLNMDLYYGFQPGEIVEVEHESDKYWMASIVYSYRHLVLLEWLGISREFWVDTSSNSTLNSSNNFDEFGNPRRIFPLGHHLQSQLKSQFSLEKPTKALVRPSLYDPSKDPYAGITTIEQLLNYEPEACNKDTFRAPSPTSITGDLPVSLSIANCKTKINYGQEDVDELEAALHNLNEIESDNNQAMVCSPSPDVLDSLRAKVNEKSNLKQEVLDKKPTIGLLNGSPNDKTNIVDKDRLHSDNDEGNTVKPSDDTSKNPPGDPTPDEEYWYDFCRQIQGEAVSNGFHSGLEKYCTREYHAKPRQLFDIGGANHERVLVPGTLVEVSHMPDNSNISHWFAYIVKNVAGRLLMRWYICSEPKFKQGRLELKSVKSPSCLCIDEDPSSEVDVDENQRAAPKRVLLRDITFNMHFTDQRLSSIVQNNDTNRSYQLPKILISAIESTNGLEAVESLTKTLSDQIFDPRRHNLDRDRPIIDHLFSVIAMRRPKLIEPTFQNDKTVRRSMAFAVHWNSKLGRVVCFKNERTSRSLMVNKSLGEADDTPEPLFNYPLDVSDWTLLPYDWIQGRSEIVEIDLVDESRDVPSNDTKMPLQNDDSGESNSLQVEYQIPPQSIGSQADSEPATSELSQITFSSISSALSSDLTTSTDSRKKEHVFKLVLDTSYAPEVEVEFKVGCEVEVYVGSSQEVRSDENQPEYQLGRVTRLIYPLIWVQIDADQELALCFDSNRLHPRGWCELNGLPLSIKLTPSKTKRCSAEIDHSDRDRKRLKTIDLNGRTISDPTIDKAPESPPRRGFVIEIRDRVISEDGLEQSTVTSRVANSSEMMTQEESRPSSPREHKLTMEQIFGVGSNPITIYFNHKCFTGPSLSKSKICSLSQYVGPGPMGLVLEEVMTKVISVAYVPPRILNDLSSQSFLDLLEARKLERLVELEFKAKYQKRVLRAKIPVCLHEEDVAAYCEAVCEHLKCCYNLFGLGLYDGDDCPGHCRALTKSNKFMKRAAYYRDKARSGEFTTDHSGASGSSGSKSKSSQQAASKNMPNKGQKSQPTTSRPTYGGRDSSESSSSSASSRAIQSPEPKSSQSIQRQLNDVQENIAEEVEDEQQQQISNDQQQSPPETQQQRVSSPQSALSGDDAIMPDRIDSDSGPSDDSVLGSREQHQEAPSRSSPTSVVKMEVSPRVESTKKIKQQPPPKRHYKLKFLEELDSYFLPGELSPKRWSIKELADTLQQCEELAQFSEMFRSERIDGKALLLLDRFAIRELFQQSDRIRGRPSFRPDQLEWLTQFVDYCKMVTETRLALQERRQDYPDRCDLLSSDTDNDSESGDTKRQHDLSPQVVESTGAQQQQVKVSSKI